MNSENFNEKYGITGPNDALGSGGEVRSAPPTVRGEVARPTTWVDQKKLRVWPGVVGGIGVVFGFGGVLASLWGLAMSTVTATVGMQQYQLDVMPRWYTIVSGIASMSLAAILGAAGIGLLRKQAWGAWLARRWAVVKIALVAVTSVILVAATGDFFAELWWGGAGSMGGAGATVFFTIMSIVGILFAVVWTFWLPILMLYWLNKKSVKQDIAGWRNAASAQRGGQA